MERVLITGGSGLVGKHLNKKLTEKGYEVLILSRNKTQINKSNVFYWNPEKEEIDSEAIEKADYIIHLAGANIGEKRWVKKQKQVILDSRVKTANLILKTIKEKNLKPKAFISASATGYYGAITSNKEFTETDSSANDFLGKTCNLWEKSADEFTQVGIRTVKIRTGLVLSKKGGALYKMLLPVKIGFGSPIGSGKQIMPWIHIHDLCNIYIKAIEDIKMEGAYNAIAPEHLTNKEFMKTLATVLKKPFWFPNVPSFVLKILFGEMSQIILKGSRVSSKKIMKAGYDFEFTNLKTAFKNLLRKHINIE